MDVLEEMIAILALLVALYAPHDEYPTHTAMLYADAAEESGFDVLLLLAISYHESRLTSGLVSRTGACGIMQVRAPWSRWTCSEMQTTQGGIAAGVEALTRWNGDVSRYGGGNAGSRRYERTVRRYLKEIEESRSKQLTSQMNDTISIYAKGTW